VSRTASTQYRYVSAGVSRQQFVGRPILCCHVLHLIIMIWIFIYSKYLKQLVSVSVSGHVSRRRFGNDQNKQEI